MEKKTIEELTVHIFKTIRDLRWNNADEKTIFNTVKEILEDHSNPKQEVSDEEIETELDNYTMDIRDGYSKYKMIEFAKWMRNKPINK